jgi:hypothetical protein
MDDLDAVAFFERGLLPVGSADDLAVEFNGEAFGREREVLDEFGERDGFGHVALLAVDLDNQKSPPLWRQAWWMTRRSSALCPPAVALTRIAARPEVK